jgi:DNA modification methylase
MNVEPIQLSDAVALYHGDCRDILPSLLDIKNAVVLSDPPYGIGFKYNQHKDKGGDEYRALIRCLKPFPKCLLQYPEETMALLVPEFGPPDECFTWCYNSNIARQTRIFSFWGVDVDFRRERVLAKNPSAGSRNKKPVDSVAGHYDWTTNYQQVKNVSHEKTGHPCQIPVELLQLIVRFIKADVIIDPFLGSGSTGIAAIKQGKKFIGIEIDEAYFNIARNNIRQHLVEGSLFKREIVRPEQTGDLFLPTG